MRAARCGGCDAGQEDRARREQERRRARASAGPGVREAALRTEVLLEGKLRHIKNNFLRVYLRTKMAA